MIKQRPICRYHGGKFKQAVDIISLFPPHKIYVEPYCGVASVLLQKKPAYAEVINDLDSNIYNLFSIMQDDRIRKLCQILETTLYSREAFENAVAASRRPNKPEYQIRNVANFIIRNQMSFSPTPRAGFRADTKREYSIPSHDWVAVSDILKSYIDRLKGVVIENKDAVEVISAHDTNQTLFYLDPPYLPDTRGGSSSYRFDYLLRDHKELLAAVTKLQGMVVLSGYKSDLYQSILEPIGWQRIDKQVFADGNQRRVECLWLNPLCQANQQQTDLFTSNLTKETAHV
ncbi:MAG: DNA adenine methylase [Rhizobiales bacterium]|nr:DNA adenine methylase [Hyphomicrobiales bacterium]